jgi:hypothetical protein
MVFHRDMMRLFDQTNRFLNAASESSKIQAALVFGSGPKSIHDMNIIEIECNKDRIEFPSNRMDLSRLRTICARKIVRLLIGNNAKTRTRIGPQRLNLLIRAPPGLKVPGFTPKVRLHLGIPKRIVRQQKAREKYERRIQNGKKTQKNPPPFPEMVSVLRVVRFEEKKKNKNSSSNSSYNIDKESDNHIWYLAKSRPKGFRGGG